MASYDSPGHPDPLPGLPPIPSHDYMTAPGSQPGAAGTPPASPPLPQGTVERPVIVDNFGSTYSAVSVPVGPSDTLVGPQAGLYQGRQPDGLSGVPGELVGETGAGKGRAGHVAHPNSHHGGEA